MLQLCCRGDGLYGDIYSAVIPCSIGLVVGRVAMLVAIIEVVLGFVSVMILLVLVTESHGGGCGGGRRPLVGGGARAGSGA